MEYLLTEHEGIISIHFAYQDGRLTIIGDVDPMRVLFLLNRRDETANIVSVGPAQKHEQNKIYNTKNDAIKKFVLEVNIRNLSNWEDGVVDNLLTNHRGIISIHFDNNDPRLTIVGGVDPVRMISFWRDDSEIQSISIGPAEEHEQSKSYNSDTMVPIRESPFKKFVLEVKFPNITEELFVMGRLATRPGIISIDFNNNDERLTIIGNDDIILTGVLRYISTPTKLISIGPAAEHKQYKSYNPMNVIKKIVLGVKSSSLNVNTLIKELSSLPDTRSVHFDKKDRILTIVGDPTCVLDVLDIEYIEDEPVIDIISIGLAEGPFSKATSRCSVM